MQKLVYFLLVLSFCLAQHNPILAAESVLLTSLPIKNIDQVETESLLTVLESSLNERKIATDRHDLSEILITSSKKGLSKSLEEALKVAQDFQFDFQDKRAIGVLKTALVSFDQNTPNLTSLSKLADAYLFMAYCYKNIRRTKEMNRTLDEAARLNPSLVASELLYPPSLISAFERAKDRIWSQGHFSKLEIKTEPPGARVFVNGMYKGNAPLRLEKHPTGWHHINALWGKKSAYKKVTLTEGRTSSLKLRPNKSVARRSRAKKGKAIAIGQTKAQKKWLKNILSRAAREYGLGIAVIPKRKQMSVVVQSVGFSKNGPTILRFAHHESVEAMSQKIISSLF